MIKISIFLHLILYLGSLLYHCTGKTLCLIDEFGKGTSPSDAIALTIGLLDNLGKVEEKLSLIIVLKK